jgi:hypothetical protein
MPQCGKRVVSSADLSPRASLSLSCVPIRTPNHLWPFTIQGYDTMAGRWKIRRKAWRAAGMPFLDTALGLAI